MPLVPPGFGDPGSFQQALAHAGAGERGSARRSCTRVNLLRRALGERRINYYGLSCVAMLGATLISMFTHHVRAIVLDAVPEPLSEVPH
jgi:hypothetical protein